MQWSSIALLFPFLVLFFLERWLRVPYDAREPALIPQPFPFIGHLLGMLRHGSHYYTRICQTTKLPIYTLVVPGKKIYIVTAPNLAAQVDRNSKVISFAPYVVLFAKRVLAPSKEALHCLAENLEEEGNWGCRPQTMKAMHLSMAHGDDLENTTRVMLESLASQMASVEKIAPLRKMNLFQWVKRVITQASTDAVYGQKHNPFHDPALVKSFWSVNADFALLGLGIFPNITAPKGYRGRERLFESFRKYYTENKNSTASPLVRARFEVNRKHGISIDDIARFELSVCIALLVNTVPATFWCIYHVYSRAELLEKVRSGITSFSTNLSEQNANCSYSVDVADLLTKFPLLEAIVRESLRILSTNASGRVLLKDIMLDGRYLLKKDSLLLLPSAELHNNASVWGDDFQEFNPERWFRSGMKSSSSAYRAFGGGSSLCPGRYLSMNEIMVGLVVMVMKYDLVPTAGRWKLVKTGFHITTSVLTPQDDIEVEVKNRAGYEQVHWSFLWKGLELQTVQI